MPLERLTKWLSNPWWGLVSLMLLQTRVLWGAWDYLDLVHYDPSAYFSTSRQLAAELIFPALDWSPFYISYYAPFHKIWDTPFTIFLAHYLLMIYVILVLFYVLCRRLFSPGTAWILGVYFTVTYGVVYAEPLRYFILGVLLSTLLIAVTKPRFQKGFILVGLCLAMLTRPEFGFAFLLLSAWFLSEDYRKSNLRLALYPYRPLLILGLIMPILILRGGGINSGRSRQAFGQHFCTQYAARHPEMESCEATMGRLFDYADSPVKAFLVNPGAMLEHMFWNFKQFRTELPAVLGTVTSPAVSSLLWAGICLLIVVGGWQLVRRWNWQLLRCEYLYPILFAIVLFNLLSALTINSYRVFIIPFLIPFMLLVGALLETVLKQHSRWLLLLFPVMIFLLPMPMRSPTPQINGQLVDAMRPVAPGEPYALLSEPRYGVCLYVSATPCQNIPPASTDDFASWLVDNQVAVILVSPALDLTSEQISYVEQQYNHYRTIQEVQIFIKPQR